MGIQIIGAPTVQINGETFKVKGAAIKYNSGFGKINVGSASLGGGKSVSTHSKDATEEWSELTFSIPLEQDSDAFIAEWQRNIASNEVRFLEKLANGNSFVRVFPSMSLAEDPQREISDDPSAELIFRGDQMIEG